MGGGEEFFASSLSSSSSSKKDGDDAFAFPERDSDEENLDEEKEEGEKTRVMKTRVSKEEEDKEDEKSEEDDSEDDSSVSEEELEEYEKLDDTLNTDSKGAGGQSGDFVRSSSSSDGPNEEHDKEYYPNAGPKTKDEHERQTKLRLMIIRQRDKEFKLDQKFKSKSIVKLNNEAVEALKKGDDIEAIAKYAKVFRKVHENNLTHELMHVCHSNRAVAYLNLGLFEEALWDANKSQDLANERYYRTQSAGGQVLNVFVKGYARKGFALMGLRMHRLAKSVFETGLEFSPKDEELKRGLEEAVVAVLADLHNGKGFVKNRETFQCLPAPEKKHQQERLTNLPYASPLHRVHPKDMLPTQLLTPFQAENDYHLKDTYNYMTVQADIAIPKRHFKYLEDTVRRKQYTKAIEIAIKKLQNENKDVRALHLGCGAGLMTMHLLDKGAHHVTACERWLYQAMACKENLLNNGFCDDQVKVIYKRPTDLSLLADVPVYCNLFLNDIIDDGLLSSGLIPSTKHCLQNLLLPDCIVLPSSATVFAQAIEIKSRNICGLDVSAMDLYRSHPTYSAGVPIDPDSYRALSKPKEIWHFDLGNPPEASDQKFVDFEFTKDGTFNAVLFWYELHLIEDVKISTRGVTNEEEFGDADDDDDENIVVSSLTPSLFYLDGEIKSYANHVVPIKCSHNTVAMQFTVEDADYMHMMKKDASFPKYQFSILADERRAKAYDAAIQRQIKFLKNREGYANVLDIGSGSGLLTMMAARANADTVISCEMLPSLATCTRRNVAQNNLSRNVNVICKDAALLERGIHGPHEGCNMIVVDLFDCGLTGEHVLYMIEEARRKVANVGSVVVPAAATIYAMGVEAYTTEIDGFDMSAQNKYRWDSKYEPVEMENVKHRRLTKPKKVFEFFFDNSMKQKGRETVIKLETVASGYLNAVVFWFDLHMDEEETITTAPKGIGKGGRVQDEAKLMRDLDGKKTKKVMEESLRRVREKLARNPRAKEYEGVSSSIADADADVDGAHNKVKEKNTEEIGGALATQTSYTTDDDSDSDDDDDGGNNHYWGQAMQYLERAVQIKGGKKIAVLAKREADVIRFSLKEGVGSWVGKPPWKIEWGGGASVESPHFQRVHYCQLLVNDFLMRLRSKRFAPIEKDMRMILAHCGSLFLDPEALTDVYHRLVALELLHGAPEFSPGASMEALTKPTFRLH